MNTTHECCAVMAVLGAVLLGATLIGLLLRRICTSPKYDRTIDNLNCRVRAWWIIVAIVGGAILGGRNTVILLFSLVSFCALREFLTVSETGLMDRPALLACYCLALPLQYALIWRGWYGLYSILIPVYGVILIPMIVAFGEDRRNFLARTAEIQWGLLLAVYCVSYVPALLTLNISGFQKRTIMLIAFLLIVAESTDVFQYVFGKLLGRHKILPQLSPSKTVEGFIGGILAATTLGASLSYMTPFGWRAAAAMALTIALTGSLGGFVMSAVKRDRGIKDWSCLIPGHGGVLDRLDSICFSAPIFFHLTRYFYAQ